MKQCDCHHTTTYTRCDGLKAFIKHECWGTRERDECSCGGDRTKCDFYPDVREKALQEIEPEFGEWINVKDRLPDVSGRYLTHCDVEGQSLVCILYFEQFVYGFEKEVTHWMLLPEPPKGE